MTLPKQANAYTPFVFAKAAVPFVDPPSGNMGNNGAFTLGTALPRALAGCFMWFAANQIAAGSAPGWYWTTMSSATAATVFSNTYPGGVPQPVANPVSFATTGPGAITGVTGSIGGIALTLPAGLIGANGVLRFSDLWSLNNSANNKSVGATLGGQIMPTPALTTAASVSRVWTLYNNGNANQVIPPPGIVAGVGSAAGVVGSPTLNMTNAQQLVYTLNTAAATDWIIHEAFMLEAMA